MDCNPLQLWKAGSFAFFILSLLKRELWVDVNGEFKIKGLGRFLQTTPFQIFTSAFSTSEGGMVFVCWGKNSSACHVEFWKMAFSWISHHKLNCICGHFFVIDWGKVIRRKRCQAVTLAVVQVEDLYTLSLLATKMHAQNCRFNPKLSFKSSSNEKYWLVWIKVCTVFWTGCSCIGRYRDWSRTTQLRNADWVLIKINLQRSMMDQLAR